MLTKYDKVLIYFLLSLSFLTFMSSTYWARSFGKEIKEVEVTAGEISRHYSLKIEDGKRVFRLKGCLVEIDRGKVRVKSSSCPRKLCVAQGWIKSPGQNIICLPHKIVIKVIQNNRQSPLDSVVR